MYMTTCRNVSVAEVICVQEQCYTTTHNLSMLCPQLHFRLPILTTVLLYGTYKFPFIRGFPAPLRILILQCKYIVQVCIPSASDSPEERTCTCPSLMLDSGFPALDRVTTVYTHTQHLTLLHSEQS